VGHRGTEERTVDVHVAARRGRVDVTALGAKELHSALA